MYKGTESLFFRLKILFNWKIIVVEVTFLSSGNRPFALRGHVSFAAMLGGKQMSCYALLWKKWLPLMTGKGKYIKFPRHFWLCFKTMGYLQTRMMCTSLSDSIKNRSFIYWFKNRFRCSVHFNSLSTLPCCSNLQTYSLYCRFTDLSHFQRVVNIFLFSFLVQIIDLQ